MEQKEELTVIAGAGALGAMYAQQIHAAGLRTAFVAEGERGERLRRTGLQVNGKPLNIPVVDWTGRMPGGAAQSSAAANLQEPVVPARLIVALKNQHLPDVLPRLATLCGPDTTVISVMNGIDSEHQIAAALGEGFVPEDTGRVLHCMVAGMDAVRDGTDVRFSRLGTVFFGRRRNDPEALDARVLSMQRFLDAAQIPSSIVEDMEKALWNKFMLNVGINQWSAVLGATYDVFHQIRSAQTLMRRAMREVLHLAHDRAIDLTQEDLEHWFTVVNTLSPEGKTSMLQDIEAGRKTEVEMFAGRVVEIGKEIGVPTPVNTVLLEAIHALESMSANKA